VMFVVPAAVGIYLQSRGDRRTAMRNVLTYFSTAFVFSSAAYYTCFHLATGQTEVAGYLRWITWHTPDSAVSFNVARNTWLTLRGTLRLALGGRVGAFHSGLLPLGGMLALLGLGVILVLRTGPGRERQPASPARAFWGSWIAVYVGFLFFWLPQNTFYRLFYLPPVVVLAATALRKWGGRRAMEAAFGLLGVWNYLFYIHPRSLVETNPVLRAALAMRPAWKPGTWVYQGSFNADNWIVFAFNPQVMFKGLNREKLIETTRELKSFAETGHQTWLDQSGIDLLESDQVGSQWLTEHTRPGFKREFYDGKSRLSFVRLFP